MLRAASANRETQASRRETHASSCKLRAASRPLTSPKYIYKQQLEARSLQLEAFI
jgi:hypothetical protein